MAFPLEITFRHMDPSETIEALIREKVAKLETFPDHILSCRVVVEPKGKHRQDGNLYDVRIDLTVPGEEIVISRQADEHTEYRDLNVALRDAFDSARRQLTDHVRRRQHQ